MNRPGGMRCGKVRREKRFRKGFTLAELMVAMALTVTMSTIILSVAIFTMETWTRGRSEVRASRQAMAMADSLTRDFDAMVVRRENPFQWLAAEARIPDGGPNGNQRSPNAARIVFFSAATDRYNGQTAAPGTAHGGNISTVVYELHYKNPIGGNSNEDYSTFVLYRKIVNPDSTFNDLLCRTDLAAAMDAYSASIGETENFICENVYQFTVTFHVEVAGPQGGKAGVIEIPVQIGQNGLAGSVTKFGVFGNRIETPSEGSQAIGKEQLAAGKIAGVEVSLTILTDFGLQQMRRRKFSSVDERERFIGRNSFQYSKLISVPGR